MAEQLITKGAADISDVRLTDPTTLLPIRGEKRIIPSFVTLDTTQDFIDSGIAAGGLDPQASTNPVQFSDFLLTAAKRAFVDYLHVRLPHRGLDAQGNRDLNTDAVFRFLINPATVSVNKQAVDYQALTRGGWQFGVWGEDLTRISLSGMTAGQYFHNGLTDAFNDFSVSYRNLQQLKLVFENNGYWFEGEELNEGPLAADFTRRRIKVHQDVELTVGNFIWSGMFDSLTVSQNAEQPFLAKFDIQFIAWKERFRVGSPYPDTNHNDVQRGHSYYQLNFKQQVDQQRQINNSKNLPGIDSPAPASLAGTIIPADSPMNLAPAVQAAGQESLLVPVSSDVFSQNFNKPVFDPSGFTDSLFPWK